MYSISNSGYTFFTNNLLEKDNYQRNSRIITFLCMSNTNILYTLAIQRLDVNHLLPTLCSKSYYNALLRQFSLDVSKAVLNIITCQYRKGKGKNIKKNCMLKGNNESFYNKLLLFSF